METMAVHLRSGVDRDSLDYHSFEIEDTCLGLLPPPGVKGLGVQECKGWTLREYVQFIS